MRRYNRWFRRHRIVVENTIARIKEWSIVRVPFRGDINDQSDLFMLSAQLTARMMRIRDAAPRNITDIRTRRMAVWEQQLGQALWVDSDNTDAY